MGANEHWKIFAFLSLVVSIQIFQLAALVVCVLNVFCDRQEGRIICPSTESTYDLKTGKMVEWMPTNPILRVLTPSLRDLVTYPVKVEDDSIYINVQGRGDLAEMVFGGASTGQAGRTASNIDVDEVCVKRSVSWSQG